MLLVKIRSLHLDLIVQINVRKNSILILPSCAMMYYTMLLKTYMFCSTCSAPLLSTAPTALKDDVLSPASQVDLRLCG